MILIYVPKKAPVELYHQVMVMKMYNNLYPWNVNAWPLDSFSVTTKDVHSHANQTAFSLDHRYALQ